MFPATRELARFSDLVGASHGDDYSVWKFNSEAGEGLKMLAEQGNTTKLEMEIQATVSRNKPGQTDREGLLEEIFR